MAALQYLESLRNSHPELSDWYNSLADLYQNKLWHQLTLKLEQFVALAVFQVTLLSLLVLPLFPLPIVCSETFLWGLVVMCTRERAIVIGTVWKRRRLCGIRKLKSWSCWIWEIRVSLGFCLGQGVEWMRIFRDQAYCGLWFHFKQDHMCILDYKGLNPNSFLGIIIQCGEAFSSFYQLTLQYQDA